MIDIAGDEFEPRRQTETIADGPAKLHHYFSRSWEEFECKRVRGRGASAGSEMRPQSSFYDHDQNEIVLDDALRLAAATKEEIARLTAIVKG
jgi:hypothetical protein